MDADSIGQSHLVEFPKLVLDRLAIKLDDKLLRVGVNPTDVTDITVENLIVVVVVGLHHLVTDAIGKAKAFDEYLIDGRVQSSLEVHIQ